MTKGEKDDIVGPRWKLTRRFAKGIEKLAGNTLGDYRKKIERLAVRMLEAIGLAGRWLDCMYPEIKATANGCQQLNCPGLAGKPLVPGFRAIDDG
ncbi:hypothetical protein GW17_00047536 [Ensete ventricosum]|nr:hypothetical protein GW17_00047536 [Ensete ventricosum]